MYSNLPHESEKSEGIYPRQRLDDISKCMADWDEKDVSKQLSLLLEDIKRKNLSLQQVKCIGIELSSMLIQSFSGNVSEISDFNVFSICEYQTVDELANIISGVSASVSSYLSSKTQLKNSSDIQRIMSIIDDNYDNSQFSLENMCSEFSVTPQTLRRRFKQATGTTMNDYMTNLRIEKAKKLLRSTGMDLSAISSQCGWNDQNVFIRAFKAREGVTPGRFREKVG